MGDRICITCGVKGHAAHDLDVHERVAAERGWEPPHRDKPRWVDLFGIDPDYTAGKDVNEWLDEQRGDA